jgi:excisionase family DNA binding protein
MNHPVRRPDPAREGTPLRVNLEGPPELVTAMLAAIAGTLAPTPPAEAPTALYLPLVEVARRTGIKESRLRGWVKDGRLPNHNLTGSRILLSMAEVTALTSE